jgi:glycerol-3-phosphate acyltransferase PlsY
VSVAILLVKVLAAYLLGSLSGSLILGGLRGVDIRTLGSGNAGGTNALRTQGWRFALAVVVIDIGKGAVAAALAWLPPAGGFAPLPVAALLGFACAVGHVWPLYFGFRGGKGAAVVVGAVAVFMPAALLVAVPVWLLGLALSGYVGPSTVAAALSLPLSVPLVAAAGDRPAALAAMVAYAVLIAWTHRSNLARLAAGTENRFERARILGRWLGRGGGA